jgi:hypothetical protein
MKSAARCTPARTMSAALNMIGYHIGLSRDHFFCISPDPSVIKALVAAALDLPVPDVPRILLPMEVEEGALLVQPEGAAWAVAISRQHRQRLRQHPSLRLESLISLHCLIPRTLWSQVEGNGYCGYEVIRQMLIPDAPKFRLSDSGLRASMQLFLLQLLAWLTPELSTEFGAHVMAAAEHLQSATMLPRHAWSHMDLVMHFANKERLPFWTPGRTPVHSVHWIGQHCAHMGIPRLNAQGAAFNVTDHFSTFLPPISESQLMDALSTLARALRGESLLSGWTQVEGSPASHAPISPSSSPDSLLASLHSPCKITCPKPATAQSCAVAIMSLLTLTTLLSKTPCNGSG